LAARAATTPTRSIVSRASASTTTPLSKKPASASPNPAQMSPPAWPLPCSAKEPDQNELPIHQRARRVALSEWRTMQSFTPHPTWRRLDAHLADSFLAADILRDERAYAEKAVRHAGR